MIHKSGCSSFFEKYVPQDSLWVTSERKNNPQFEFVGKEILLMQKYMTPLAILSEEPHGPFLPGGNLFCYKHKLWKSI